MPENNGPAKDGPAHWWDGVLQAVAKLRDLGRKLSEYFAPQEDEPVSGVGDDIAAAFKHLHWGRVARLLPAAALLVYLGSGLYVVRPGEVGVIRTFGRVTQDEVGEGLHWRWPWPIQKVNRVNVTAVQREGIGVDIPEHKPPICPPGAEFHVLTGDENVVNIKVVAQYVVQDAGDYLFRVKLEPYGIVRNCLKHAATETIGRLSVDDILTRRKVEAQNAIQRLAQKSLDLYGAGIKLVNINFEDVAPPEAVRDAFKEVSSAREEAEKKIHDAEAYRNSLMARAQGEADQLRTEAEGYAVRTVKQAEGDAAKFLQMTEEYRKNVRIYSEDVTRARYFLETMEKIMPRVKKYLVKTGPGQLNLRLFSPSED